MGGTKDKPVRVVKVLRFHMHTYVYIAMHSCIFVCIHLDIQCYLTSHTYAYIYVNLYVHIYTNKVFFVNLPYIANHSRWKSFVVLKDRSVTAKLFQ